MGTLRSGDTLRRAHELIVEMIVGLEALMRSRSRRADVPRLLVAGALDFFTGFVAGCHETKEEEAFFPALEAGGEGGGGRLHRLAPARHQPDHRAGPGVVPRQCLADARGCAGDYDAAHAAAI